MSKLATLWMFGLVLVFSAAEAQLPPLPPHLFEPSPKPWPHLPVDSFQFIYSVCDGLDDDPPRPLWTAQPKRKPYVIVDKDQRDESSLGKVVRISCDPDRLGHLPDPEAGNPEPRGADLQNLTTNFHYLESIEMLASVLTKVTSALGTFDTPAAKAEQTGKCVCKDGNSFCFKKDSTREKCVEACADDINCVGGEPLWLPSDAYKDFKGAARYTLDLIHLLDDFQKVTDSKFYNAVQNALKVAGTSLDETASFLSKLNCWIDSGTEGYHLGAYSKQRPDLHLCVSHQGHGAYAQLAESSRFNLGARYTSHNLSATSRAQLRTGGFALSAFGRNLTVRPAPEVNLQIDGFRLFDACRPLGIAALGGPASLCGSGAGPRIWIGEGAAPEGSLDADKVDIFHLVDRKRLEVLDSNGDKHVDPGEFLVATYKPFPYGSGDLWPRPEIDQPWEGTSAAVVSAGLNLNPSIKPLEKFILPPIPIGPATVTPVLRLTAGIDWSHEAYRLRKRLQEAINRNLPADQRLDSKDFNRPQHAFQAPDVTADDGVAVSVRPEVALQLALGVPLSRNVQLGISASLGTAVDLRPAGTAACSISAAASPTLCCTAIRPRVLPARRC